MVHMISYSPFARERTCQGRKERGDRHCVKQEACARKDGPRSKKLGEEQGVGIDIGGWGYEDDDGDRG